MNKILFTAVFAALAAVNGDASRTAPEFGFEGALPSSTPEPVSLFLIGGGLMGLGLIRRPRSKP